MPSASEQPVALGRRTRRDGRDRGRARHRASVRTRSPVPVEPTNWSSRSAIGTAVAPRTRRAARSLAAAVQQAPSRAAVTAPVPRDVCTRASARLRRLRAAAGDLLAHGGRDLGAVELDRVHDRVVRERADAELEQEAVVLEDRVLEQDLLDHLVGGADDVVALRASRRPRTGRGSSAASRARGRSGPSTTLWAG